MAVPMAYGDSRSYFQYRSAAQMARAAQSQALMGSPNAQLPRYNEFSNLVRYGGGDFLDIAAQYVPHRPPVVGKSPQRVIVDRGFGGADGRPRSRRYAA